MLLSFELKSFEVTDKNEELLACRNIISLFIRGLGGFGYKGKPA